ncbi:chemotaxis protein CheW [Leptothermofonsia sp. ETS-13]|uniref:chemotaxis protein CheW n=1 Tax=Leptothermofonsia sp. ETS-13 TaxID=3035696 RepID=UPI003BA104B2
MQSSDLVPHALRSPKLMGEAYLKLYLDETLPVLLLMRQVLEVLVLPTARLTPMPNVPPPVLGLINRRSRVLWLVDLPQVLGLGALDGGRPWHAVAIIQVGTLPLALAVHRVEGMGWWQPHEIHPPPPHLPPHLIGFLHGCVLLQHQMLPVLNPESIVNAPVFLNHDR